MQQTQQEKMILSDLFQATARYHQHLCPRQVLGVRMGLYAGELLSLPVPQKEKILYTLIETDGCFMDGVAVATGCTPGARTMRVYDFGKVAATFINRNNGQALRISPKPSARALCSKYAGDVTDRWHVYLFGYQEMPEDELFAAQPVNLSISLEEIISRKNAKEICTVCGEEIFNEREVMLDGEVVCKGCAGQRYYEYQKSSY